MRGSGGGCGPQVLSVITKSAHFMPARSTAADTSGTISCGRDAALPSHSSEHQHITRQGNPSTCSSAPPMHVIVSTTQAHARQQNPRTGFLCTTRAHALKQNRIPPMDGRRPPECKQAVNLKGGDVFRRGRQNPSQMCEHVPQMGAWIEGGGDAGTVEQVTTSYFEVPKNLLNPISPLNLEPSTRP